MKQSRALVVAGYLIAAMLVLIPLSEVLLTGLPLRPASVTWRFSTGGTFSRALMTPLLGLLLAIGLASVFSHRLGMRILTVASGLFGLLALFVALRYSLDAATMFAGAPGDARAPLMRTTVPVFLKLAVSILVSALLCVGAWRATGAPAPSKRAGHERGSGKGEGTEGDMLRTRAPVIR